MGDFIDLQVSNALDTLFESYYNILDKTDEEVLSDVIGYDTDLNKQDLEKVKKAIAFYLERNNIRNI